MINNVFNLIEHLSCFFSLYKDIYFYLNIY